MVVTVNIPDELAAATKARGLSLEACVQEILAQELARPTETRQPRTPEEIRAWLDSLAQFSDKIPPLPETISRDWLYQDHDYMAIARRVCYRRTLVLVDCRNARWTALCENTDSQENYARKQDGRNRNQELRTAGCARCGVPNHSCLRRTTINSRNSGHEHGVTSVEYVHQRDCSLTNGHRKSMQKRNSGMRASRLPVLFGSFLAIISGLGSGHAQSATPSFTISASNVTMPTRGNGSIPFTLTSVNGFAGAVVVSCGPANPPTGSILPQCNYTGSPIAPPPYTLTANGTVRGSLSLVAYIPPCSSPCPVKLQPRPRQRGAVNLALSGALLLGLGFRRRAARWLALALFAAGMLAELAGVIACGAGSIDDLSPGIFAYTVSATQSGTTRSQAMVVNTTVNVTVPADIPTNLPSANP